LDGIQIPAGRDNKSVENTIKTVTGSSKKSTTPSKTLIAAAGQRLFLRVPKPVEIQRPLDARYFAG